MHLVPLFRFLVLASLIIGVVGGAIDYVVPGIVPADLLDHVDTYFSAGESVVLVSVVGVSALVVLVASLVATVGLWRFKRWARPLALWSTLLLFPIYPLMGPELVSGWQTALTELSMMMWGGAIAMAYHSELSARFE